MRNLMLFYLFGVLMLSCTKEGGNVSAEGRVYNPITGEGYEGFEIKLTEDSFVGGAPGAQSSNSRTINSIKSDSDGKYSLSGVALGAGATLRFFTNHSKFYKIGIGNNTVTGEPNEYSTIGLKTGKHNKVDFWVVPYSNSKLIINNLNCAGEDDIMVLYRRNQINSIDDSYGWEHYGCAYWETNGYSQIPMGEVYYRWEVTRNGITNIYYDTVLYPANEFVTYEIAY